MSLRQVRGHALTEYALISAVIAGVWLLPWGEGPAIAYRWFEAWWQWLTTTVAWLASG